MTFFKAATLSLSLDFHLSCGRFPQNQPADYPSTAVGFRMGLTEIAMLCKVGQLTALTPL